MEQPLPPLFLKSEKDKHIKIRAPLKIRIFDVAATKQDTYHLCLRCINKGYRTTLTIKKTIFRGGRLLNNLIALTYTRTDNIQLKAINFIKQTCYFKE